ncbi:BON domain-containing protein [Nisaea acidiphila]|uniref:BON domain-containing protein n=1 Tax=Nisaea acidiphila TaxID=1862145 RepID=A0A9J7B3F4_9PROT|nr:BON domain-containing protein [Nisaea acidiphila]UUX52165.1 BON domain-containing protein [Nisaea acidiphila]
MPRAALLLLPLFLLPLAAGGCTPVGVAVGAGATAATASQSERGLEGTARDIAIKTEINHYLFQKNVDLFSAVGLSVEDGRVLLTGSVPRPEDRIEAARLAWKADGIREVINEIQVVDNSDIVDKARDTWIETQLETQMLFDSGISSINYDVDTVNGTVYLFGIAQSNAELQLVINHARNLDYVRNVVSYVRVKGAS